MHLIRDDHCFLFTVLDKYVTYSFCDGKCWRVVCAYFKNKNVSSFYLYDKFIYMFEASLCSVLSSYI